MAQLMKVLAAMSDDVSLIVWDTHDGGREQSPSSCSLTLTHFVPNHTVTNSLAKFN